MINITKKWKRNQVIINSNTINIYDINNKNYLSKKDISKIFNTKKTIIKEVINDLNIEESTKVYSKEKSKFINTYSIEKIILIWYKLKKFSETKLLLNINRRIKENKNQAGLIGYTMSLIEKINYLKQQKRSY